MTEPFLIAHKVRGEPAFDIAHQMQCPECHGKPTPTTTLNDYVCTECDQLGFWWIVSTSGHRAYPYWSQALDGLGRYSDIGFWPDLVVDEMPPDLPDHYPTRAAPTISLAEALGFTSKPKPKDTSSPFPRRV